MVAEAETRYQAETEAETEKIAVIKNNTRHNCAVEA
jgi:hypothetical protein